MGIRQADYHKLRSRLLADPAALIAAERKYMDLIVAITLAAAKAIYTDFSRANELVPFWINYAPKQRGRKPRGTSIPWSEVGEKSISANLVKAICQKIPSISFPGLPFGGDVRFATEDAFLHFDVKMTGPNDNPNELVVPPQQISGDGKLWKDGPVNSLCTVTGLRAKTTFQPKLPPFYLIGGRLLLCYTYFLKAVYAVQGLGIQPLDYLEVACVPNGLLLFDGPKYALTKGLFIPGKDDQTKPVEDKRVRIRLDPLTTLDGNWRCAQIRYTESGGAKVLRGE